MIKNRVPGLEELAFEGRNKDYGAFDLRQKYFRNLLISMILGIFIVLSFVFIPLLYYYFEPIPLVEGDIAYEVEYYDMSAPPDQELNKLARSLSQPLPDAPQIPVVSDSILPKEEKPVDEPVEDKKEIVDVKTDSSANSGGTGTDKGTGDEAGINTVIDVFPRFPGGDEARLYFLRQHIRYPEGAIKNQVQGIVMVVFIVEVDGSVSHVNVSQKVGGGCDEEAMRVTREMPRWEPGKRKGRAVRVMVRMPVVFRMHGRST